MPDSPTCLWCGRPLEPRRRRGEDRLYCSRAHKVRAWEASHPRRRPPSIGELRGAYEAALAALPDQGAALAALALPVERALGLPEGALAAEARKVEELGESRRAGDGS